MSLTKPAQFVQALDNHDIEPETFCTFLLHQASRNDGVVNISATASEFNVDKSAAKRIHRLSSDFGLVDYRSLGGDDAVVDQLATTDFLKFLQTFTEYSTREELRLLADDAVHDVDLTVSVPPDFNGRSADLMARLTRLVQNAETNLLIVTPFLTHFGIDAFVDHLSNATSRGVKVDILTRDSQDNEKNREYVESVIETVENSGNLGNLQVFDYQSENGTLHAKALIADNEVAYVGSANLTSHSLRDAVEIGMVVCGPVIDDLVEFFEMVRNTSQTKSVHP